MNVVIHYGLHRPGRMEEDVKHIDVTLSNGATFTIKERSDAMGMVDITVDARLVIVPKAPNSIRIREER